MREAEVFTHRYLIVLPSLGMESQVGAFHLPGPFPEHAGDLAARDLHHDRAGIDYDFVIQSVVV
jgi:hypothetical protein